MVESPLALRSSGAGIVVDELREVVVSRTVTWQTKV